MRRTTLARALVVASLAAFFLITGALVASAQVRDTNVASGSTGRSGPVTGGNVGTAASGPSAGGIGRGTASASMDGDTTTVVDQTTVGASAPAIAGSQVSAPGAGTSTQGTNVSSGSRAVSGPVVVASVAGAQTGPSAVAGPGSTAAASQMGDAATYVEQETVGTSGPAVAGSQIVTGGGGDALSQGTNISTLANSRSGGTRVANVLGAATGPSSVALFGGTAITGQVGNDDAYLTQVMSGASGGAISGSQVTQDPQGRVGGTNRSRGSSSRSGPVQAANVLASVAGPSALAFGPGSTSSSTHGGNTGVVGSQAVGTTSGDAVTGSQVYGLASSELGILDVPNQQASDPDFFQPNTSEIPLPLLRGSSERPGFGGSAQRFDAQATDPAQPTAGSGIGDIADQLRAIPQQLRQWWEQVVAAFTGLLNGQTPPQQVPTGEQPATLAAPADQNGNGTPTATDTSAAAPTGTPVDPTASPAGTLPSVPGFDVTGSRVQNTNLATANLGFTGASSALNVGVATAGPSSSAAALAGPIPALTGAGDATAIAAQEGDAFTTLDQAALSASGDSNVGSQNVQPGQGTPTRVQDVNRAAGHVGGSGNTAAVNTGAAHSGPDADAATIAIGPFAGDTIASAGQFGETNADLEQGVVSTSGDATAGSQVEGVQGAGLGVQAQNRNFSTLGAAFSGPSRGFNAGEVLAGPEAESSSLALGFSPLAGDTVASADQFGDDDALLLQNVRSASGDATTGSQSNDIASAGGFARSQDLNISGLALSASGPANVLQSGDASAGPSADASSLGAGALASSQQWGNDSNAGVQDARASSGDGIAGSQVTDANVTGSLRSQDRNVSVGAVATTGRATSTNDGSSDAGPAAAARSDALVLGGGSILGPDALAVAGQSGDNDARWAQQTGSFSGDALAGSQGDAVSGGLFQGLNVAVGSFAGTGDARSAGTMQNVTGPAAFASSTGIPGPIIGVGDAKAFAVQDGNNLFVGSQTGDALTGDTIAGTQLRTGAASGGRQTRNIAFGSAALSGDANVGNTVGSAVGPSATAASAGVSALAASGQAGDSSLYSNQVAVGASGNGAAGSQIDGGSLLRILQGTNVTAGSLALTGTVNGGNAALETAGPSAFSAGGVDTATQRGSDVATVNQLFGARSGDTLSGTDVSGLSKLALLLLTGNVAPPGFLWEPTAALAVPTGDALTA